MVEKKLGYSILKKPHRHGPFVETSSPSTSPEPNQDQAEMFPTQRRAAPLLPSMMKLASTKRAQVSSSSPSQRPASQLGPNQVHDEHASKRPRTDSQAHPARNQVAKRRIQRVETSESEAEEAPIHLEVDRTAGDRAKNRKQHGMFASLKEDGMEKSQVQATKCPAHPSTARNIPSRSGNDDPASHSLKQESASRGQAPASLTQKVLDRSTSTTVPDVVMQDVATKSEVIPEPEVGENEDVISPIHRTYYLKLKRSLRGRKSTKYNHTGAKFHVPKSEDSLIIYELDEIPGRGFYNPDHRIFPVEPSASVSRRESVVVEEKPKVANQPAHGKSPALAAATPNANKVNNSRPLPVLSATTKVVSNDHEIPKVSEVAKKKAANTRPRTHNTGHVAEEITSVTDNNITSKIAQNPVLAQLFVKVVDTVNKDREDHENLKKTHNTFLEKHNALVNEHKILEKEVDTLKKRVNDRDDEIEVNRQDIAWRDDHLNGMAKQINDEQRKIMRLKFELEQAKKAHKDEVADLRTVHNKTNATLNEYKLNVMHQDKQLRELRRAKAEEDTKTKQLIANLQKRIKQLEAELEKAKKKQAAGPLGQVIQQNAAERHSSPLRNALKIEQDAGTFVSSAPTNGTVTANGGTLVVKTPEVKVDHEKYKTVVKAAKKAIRIGGHMAAPEMGEFGASLAKLKDTLNGFDANGDEI